MTATKAKSRIVPDEFEYEMNVMGTDCTNVEVTGRCSKSRHQRRKQDREDIKEIAMFDVERQRGLLRQQ